LTRQASGPPAASLFFTIWRSTCRSRDHVAPPWPVPLG
jgi:hypothetical protein